VEGQTGLALLDGKGEPRAEVALNPEGLPWVNLSDDLGSVRAAFQVTPAGGLLLEMLDGKKRLRVRLSTSGPWAWLELTTRAKSRERGSP
jgi:hypothetical protein